MDSAPSWRLWVWERRDLGEIFFSIYVNIFCYFGICIVYFYVKDPSENVGLILPIKSIISSQSFILGGGKDLKILYFRTWENTCWLSAWLDTTRQRTWSDSYNPGTLKWDVDFFDMWAWFHFHRWPDFETPGCWGLQSLMLSFLDQDESPNKLVVAFRWMSFAVTHSDSPKKTHS